MTTASSAETARRGSWGAGAVLRSATARVPAGRGAPDSSTTGGDRPNAEPPTRVSAGRGAPDSSTTGATGRGDARQELGATSEWDVAIATNRGSWICAGAWTMRSESTISAAVSGGAPKVTSSIHRAHTGSACRAGSSSSMGGDALLGPWGALGRCSSIGGGDVGCTRVAPSRMTRASVGTPNRLETSSRISRTARGSIADTTFAALPCSAIRTIAAGTACASSRQILARTTAGASPSSSARHHQRVAATRSATSRPSQASRCERSSNNTDSALGGTGPEPGRAAV